jgi:phosphoglycolate phosphatase
MTSRNVLFWDLDGTIADSGAGITASMNDVFTNVGTEAMSDVEIRRVIGPPLQTTMPELLLRRGLDVARTEEFIQEYRRIYIEHHLPHTPMIDGMRDVIEELSKHWHLALVTAKPQAQAEVAVRAIGMDHHMVTVVGPTADEPVHKSVLLRRALDDVEREIGVAPILERCWMIGDRNHDIEAGVQVGTKAAGVLWGFGDHEELASAGAHAVVATPVELLSLLLPRD